LIHEFVIVIQTVKCDFGENDIRMIVVSVGYIRRS